MQVRTQFPAEPRSAAAARHWVRDFLTEIGRPDLVPSAEAGVSELVTNGILHAQTPIGLQVSRSRDRVVVEVYDGSPMTEQPALDTATPGHVESTIGRGLRIVRSCAREWGVTTADNGKAIWFQPAPTGPEPAVAPGTGATDATDPEQSRDAVRESGDGPGSGRPGVAPDPELESALDTLAVMFPEDTSSAPPDADPARTHGADDRVQVRLLGVPPALVQHYRKRWLELVREMQLVALGAPSPQQEVARRFCAAAQAVHTDLYVFERDERGYSSLSEDGASVDAVLEVPRAMRDAYVEIRDLARELEASWADARLLFLHPGPQAEQLREWWTGQVIAQIDGADPTPWPGEAQVRDAAFASNGDA
jgi:anti-sigma regulatory factor (Ser/Thr protein kinase)